MLLEELIAHSMWGQEGRTKADLESWEQKLALKIVHSGKSAPSGWFGGPGTGETICQHRAGSVLPGRGKERKPAQILVTVITDNILTQEIKPLSHKAPIKNVNLI